MRTTRRLLVTLLFGTAVGAGCGDDETSTSASTSANSTVPAVSIDGNAYEPSEIRVSVGDEFEWTNDDSATHTVTAEDDTAFASERLEEGDSFRQRFETAGQFAYTCEIHPFMRGTVVVE